MIKEDDLLVLNQLVRTLGEAESRLEKAFENKNYDEFNQLKKIILQIQKKMFEVLK
jgi:hypothetical protein